MKDEFAEAGSERAHGSRGRSPRPPGQGDARPASRRPTKAPDEGRADPPRPRHLPRGRAHQEGRLRLLPEDRRPPPAVPEGPARHARTPARRPRRGCAPLLAEGHARLLPRLDPPHRAGDRARQDGPLRPGQRRADAALPRQPGDADLPRLGVAGRGPRPARLRALRPRPGQGGVRRRRRRGQGDQGDRWTRRASSRS